MRRIAMLAALPVLAAATTLVAGQQASRPFGPGRCGPVDRTYIQTAEETGGQPFFLSPAEVAKSAHIMMETSRSDGVIVQWATGTAADAARGITFPVDRFLTRLTVAGTFDTTGGSFTLTSPDGPVLPAEETVFNCGRVVSVDAPVAGTWRVTLAPSGRFWLVVHGRSELDLMSAEFVAKGGRPGHEGLFKIPGQPIAGRPATLRVELSDDHPRAPQFVLVSTRGEQIQPAPLIATGDDEFVGSITVPEEPFRVAVRGSDQAGGRYQRLASNLFHAESLEVTPKRLVDSLTAGDQHVLTFTVRNAGPAADVRILAVATRPMPTRTEPAALSLGQGQAADVSVALDVPPDLEAGTGIDLIVTATASAPRQTTNSAVLHLTVIKRQAR
jgi:von Willebrand factor A domain-containing protein 7